MRLSLDEYRKQYKEDDAVGWLAIDAALRNLYKEGSERHYAPMIHYRIGGDDPLDGISYYDSERESFHRHIISYGMSNLYYDEEALEAEFSGWGFEFTMRVKPFASDLDSETRNGEKVKNEPHWAAAVMNNLARYVYSSQRWFEPYHFIPANGPIRLDTDTKICAIAFAPDPEISAIDTAHGRLDFLQMVGITENEYEWLKARGKKHDTEELLNRMREDNPLLITDLLRMKEYV
jgi:hypothetical protein